MTDDRTSLASAYLDGELDAADVARVEGDDELLAQVEELRGARDAMRSVGGAPISTREAQLAAALEAWQRLPEAERVGARRDATPSDVEPAAAAGASAVTAMRRTRRGRSGSAWVLAAAAGLVVVLAGGLTLRSLTDGDSDDAETVAEDAAEAPAEVDAEQSLVAADIADDGDDASDVLAAESATTGSVLEPAADIADTDTDVDAPGPGPPPEDDLEELTSPDDLAVFAADALRVDPELESRNRSDELVADEAVEEDGAASADAGEVAPPTELPLCGSADQIVAPALYDGIMVVVAIDHDRDLAIASGLDCSFVASAPLP